MSKKVIVLLDEETRYMTLPEPEWENEIPDEGHRIGTGLVLTALYYGRRTGRCVIRTYSRWEDRNRPGRVTGTEYVQVTPDVFARYCLELGLDVPSSIPAEEV